MQTFIHFLLIIIFILLFSPLTPVMAQSIEPASTTPMEPGQFIRDTQNNNSLESSDTTKSKIKDSMNRIRLRRFWASGLVPGMGQYQNDEKNKALSIWAITGAALLIMERTDNYFTYSNTGYLLILLHLVQMNDARIHAKSLLSSNKSNQDALLSETQLKSKLYFSLVKVIF